MMIFRPERAPASSTETTVEDEPMRALARELDALDSERIGAPRRVIGVTGASRRAGVTTATLSLAVTEARDLNRRVMLIDANLQRPRLSALLRCADCAGVRDVIASRMLLGDVVREVGGMSNLQIVPAGRRRLGDNGAGSRASVELLLAEAREEVDLVICDLPAAEAGSSCSNWVGDLDGVALVIQTSGLETATARNASKLLKDSGADLLGVVLNHHAEADAR